MNHDNIVVTTTKPREHLIEIARLISEEINIPYLVKGNLSMAKFMETNNLTDVIAVREDRIQIISENGEFFFHPGLAIPRIKNYKKTRYDTMIEAMQLQPSDVLLDCTLGLANDAIVANFILKDKGELVGIESSPLIYAITKWGLKKYSRGSKATQESMQNIIVKNENYDTYLKKLPSKSVDIIYFDPMFNKPLYKSNGICGLRNFANYQQLDQSTIDLALKIARKRVVFKDRSNSSNFGKLNVDEIVGGKYSPVAYGVFIC
ncbi:Putative SAM-dependent methyltransferase [Desulfonispora thiosulfatigenes DSM 11270]|uniref:Putative SAM-dependent methyltransferase n=1 Tax=Desulfonispora thiosulfatigenes DSM 11270 TaxID=656914 RepID=A0A1W1VP15_DESTI|nr:class I SAM-dependent methyltransferase [Desulfonispora thiosulfatigenes]SMB95098.1 Putative SAM-dependent methyltransferase [Desulfonispora thiosulfatigenes DSM 11270]